MFQQADTDSTGRITGPQAVTFLRRSGLPNDKLKQVWITAARTSPDYLVKEEFYVALRLIAYLQNGMTADENAIDLNLEVDLPRLDGNQNN